jgi:hypothetical protein
MDFDAIAKSMKTSELVMCLASHEARMEVVDEDGSLRKRAEDISRTLLGPVLNELQDRMMPLLIAVSAELDRRIPVPE